MKMVIVLTPKSFHSSDARWQDVNCKRWQYDSEDKVVPMPILLWWWWRWRRWWWSHLFFLIRIFNWWGHWHCVEAHHLVALECIGQSPKRTLETVIHHYITTRPWPTGLVKGSSGISTRVVNVTDTHLTKGRHQWKKSFLSGIARIT